jgi:hypothetical protein
MYILEQVLNSTTKGNLESFLRSAIQKMPRRTCPSRLDIMGAARLEADFENSETRENMLILK